MLLLNALLLKLIPLYINMAAGFIAGKWLHVDRRSIASLVIYMLVPVVFFGTIAEMKMEWSLLTIPILTYMIAVLISMPFGAMALLLYRDARAGVVMQASGTGNNGYFGLPIALMLFDAQTAGLFLLGVVGTTLFDNSLGFYFAAQGRHTKRDSMLKLIRVPALYAFAAGVVWSLNGWPLPGFFVDMMQYFKGAYTILGMMLIGITIASLHRLSLDASLTLLLFIAKFLVWPAIAFALVMFDREVLNWYSEGVHRALLLISITPLSANVVAVATLFDCEPQKIATTVLISTIFALVYVPYMVSLLLIP